jgi:hypothetical protein
MGGMNEDAWLAEEKSFCRRWSFTREAEFPLDPISLVLLQFPREPQDQVASPQDQGGGGERSAQTRVPAPGMDSLSPTAVSHVAGSGELQNVQSVGKTTVSASMPFIVLYTAFIYSVNT